MSTDFYSVLLTTLVVIVAYILIKYIQKLQYWKSHNVETISVLQTAMKILKLHPGLVFKEIYQNMYDEQKSLVVMETLFKSTLIVQDLQVIKDVLITKFEDFPDRGFYVNHKDALSTNLLRINYDMWKPLRLKFSPIFTPAKLKIIVPTLSKVAEELVKLLGEQIDSGLNKIEIFELCARFTTDTIGNVSFGIECNSLREPNNEFRKQGSKAFDVSLPRILDVIAAHYQKFFNFFKLKVFDKEITDFFTQLVRDTMEYREKHSIRRNDFMDILIEAKRNNQLDEHVGVPLELIVGQVFGFFVGGYETSANTLTYALYELAKNQEVQAKARQSVQEVMAKYEQQLTYDNLQEMSYLTKVVQETLRKYPLAPNTLRVCRRSCTLQTNDKSIQIPVGTSIYIPIYGIHHNPEFYPEPQLFRPERFDENEISKRLSGTYMPFGAGPRICIGERYAKMQVALTLAFLLTNFRFMMSDETPRELRFDPSNIAVLSVKNGITLKVEKL